MAVAQQKGSQHRGTGRVVGGRGGQCYPLAKEKSMFQLKKQTQQDEKKALTHTREMAEATEGQALWSGGDKPDCDSSRLGIRVLSEAMQKILK